jgi:NitT/TauT family transport system ATP-binding protein
MNDRSIQIEGVTKSYGDTLALRRVDLELKDGSFTCLLGPSGCGKSTLLNMIAGFVAPTTGSIVVNGHVVKGPDAERGVVFQEYALFPWRTALDNVAFGPMLRGLPKAERLSTARHYLELVGLADRGAAFPAQLSGGMKQRVAIARALANKPSVLLMDEPFGALDAQTRETLQEELLAIWQQERKTVVFVTHSISEAIFLADRVVVMGTRPGMVRDVFEVGIDHPRDRTGDRFVSLEREIHTLMREEVRKLGAA